MNNYQNFTAVDNWTSTDTNFSGFSDELLVDDMVFTLLEDQKRIDSKYLFDSTGARLFQEICLLPDYYPARMELEILKDSIIPGLPYYRDVEIVEIGTGGSLKIKTLIMSLHQNPECEIHFVPVDFSNAAIRLSTEPVLDILTKDSINPLYTDFNNPLNLPPTDVPRIFCIFGGTPGNLEDFRALQLMKSVKANMKSQDRLLVGFDMKKHDSMLEKAYNDSKGLMPAFHKNILAVLNRITGAGIDLEKFVYQVVFNPERSRIEMKLRALTDLNLHLRKAGLILGMVRGESIMTATTRKYDVGEIEELAESADLFINRICSTEDNWFSMVDFSKVCG